MGLKDSPSTGVEPLSFYLASPGLRNAPEGRHSRQGVVGGNIRRLKFKSLQIEACQQL